MVNWWLFDGLWWWMMMDDGHDWCVLANNGCIAPPPVMDSPPNDGLWISPVLGLSPTKSLSLLQWDHGFPAPSSSWIGLVISLGSTIPWSCCVSYSKWQFGSPNQPFTGQCQACVTKLPGEVVEFREFPGQLGILHSTLARLSDDSKQPGEILRCSVRCCSVEVLRWWTCYGLVVDG